MLTVDIGNSRIKWALFSGGLIKENGCFDYTLENFEAQLDVAGLPDSATSLMVSCVAGEKIRSRFEQWVSQNILTSVEFAVTRSIQNGVVNSYQNPEKMGVDRWLAMLAAFNKCHAQKDELICVIDCGTAITFDALDSRGKHLGGLIMPGYQTMLQSLMKSAENIKHDKSAVYLEPKIAGLASSTNDALIMGCSQIILQGISGIINGYKNKSSAKLHCLVTGGDGRWVSSALTVDNVYDPYLVLQGLYIVSVKENE
ncbi:MAG: type III pantothenate kinase [Gammaproteobacteria bacterium]|nr:type III pantothenate kinase [Gammaproteobacteria bacterium]